MYQNLRWIEDSHQTWEYYERFVDKLPVNPPGEFLAEGDVMIKDVDVLNWMNDAGEYEFRPRLRDAVQTISRTRLRAVSMDEAPEIDEEYDCD